MSPTVPDFGTRAVRPTALRLPPDVRHDAVPPEHATGCVRRRACYGQLIPARTCWPHRQDMTDPKFQLGVVSFCQFESGGGPPGLATGYQRPSRRSIVPRRAWTWRRVESAAGRACWMTAPISCEVSPGRSRTRASARSVFMSLRRAPPGERTTRRRCTGSAGAALGPGTFGARVSDSSFSRSTAISSVRCSAERSSTAKSAASKRRLATRYSCTILSAWPMQRVVAAHASRATINSCKNNYLDQVMTWAKLALGVAVRRNPAASKLFSLPQKERARGTSEAKPRRTVVYRRGTRGGSGLLLP